MNKEKSLKEILVRLEYLEKEVFGNGKQKKDVPKSKIENFRGISGGIRLLISNNFFDNKKRTFTEIKDSLNEKGYYSSRQAIQVSLDRLSTSKGPLIKIKEKKKNYYAERK